MTHHDHPALRGRLRVTPVVLPLLALLLAFVSTLAHWQTSASGGHQGFIGPLTQLVLASHHETSRVPGGQSGNDQTANDHPDCPDGWHGSPTAPCITVQGRHLTLTADRIAPPAWHRYLVPLLRAPPLA